MTRTEFKCFFLIVVTFIAACIETDIYLPAFPDMMNYFRVSEETIQALLTWNFIGICLSGPFYGPISDSLGRKKPLLTALGLFFFGSILTLFAESFETMLTGRFLQGIGSGGCFTLGTAIIFDTFQAEKAIRATNQLNSTIPLIMATAPLLGGYLNYAYGFRSNFLAITILVLLSLTITLLFFKEPLAKEKRKPFSARKIYTDFKTVCTCVAFWQLAIAVCLLFAAYIGFLSVSTVLFVQEFGVSKQTIPLFQVALLGAWLIGSFTSRRVLAQWGTLKFKAVGVCLMLLGAISFVICALLFPTNPYPMTGGVAFYAFGANWTQGMYFPESMELLPNIKGTTASLLTSMRLLLTAIVVAITSSFYDGTIYPVVVMMIAMISLLSPCLYFYERTQRANTRPATAK